MKKLTAVILISISSFTSWSQTNIVQAEYFFDNDLGFGMNNPIAAFGASSSIDVNELIDVSALSIGMHTLGIRIMDDNNIWSIPEYVPVFVTLNSATVVSNITQGEYFFDTDPGLGSANPIPFALIQNLDINEMFPTGGLSFGMHTLNIRIKNEFDQWSITETIPVFVTTTNAIVTSDIDRAEYFIDTDPGLGAGVPLPVSTAPNIDINTLIPTAAVSLGMHTLNIRIRTVNGEWSIAESIPVFVTSTNAIVTSDIDRAEYFFDTDPGLGAGVPMPVSTAPNIDINTLIPTAAVSLGMHTLNIRIRTVNGEWSIAESIPVFVTSTNAIVTSDIDRAEYFFDTDPGLGAGVPMPVSTAPNIDINTLIPTAAVSLGMHTLNIRIRTVNGEWSIAESIPVFVDQNRQITQLEHFYNTDPGIGAATNVVIPPTNNLDINLSIPTSSLTPGSHTLAVRLGGINNIWSTTEYVTFNICTGANANFSAITTCLGDVTNFTDLSINVLASDTYSWDFDGDMVEDDNTVGNTSFTYASIGSYSATLTIDRGGCPSIFSMMIDVVNPPTASAGVDVTLCAGNPANLSGSIGGSASSVTWTGGAGSFDNLNSLTPIYTHDISEVGAGPITLTMTTDDPTGTCIATSSTVTVNILPLPTANAGGNFAICEGSLANLAGSIGGSASGSWASSGDGSFDDVTLLNAIYTPGVTDIANGAVDLTLTTDDPDGLGPCTVGIDMITLSIDPAANVNAGNDVIICATDVATLTGTISPFASNPMWSTSGSGSFSSPTLLSNTYTPSAADITAGSVTLTLTANGAGVCSQASDQLQLSIALPITAGAPSVQSNVGQVVNVDVISTSTINTGDIITVSILQDPTKGSATIQSDNTVDYTAASGTVGADTFQYQICNQCNLCNAGTVSIEILNEAPVITAPSAPFTSIAGQSVTIPLLSFVTDINDNIDLNSIQIISGPISNAVATFESNFDLTIDYSNTPFSGTDELTIEVCDLLGSCTQITFQVEVDGEITAYNGISPNGDGLNDFFLINNIQFLEPDNKVTIYNRWGDPVYEQTNYNPDQPNRRFEGKQNGGKDLPSGVYFYRVKFLSNRPELTGYLTIKK